MTEVLRGRPPDSGPPLAAVRWREMVSLGVRLLGMARMEAAGYAVAFLAGQGLTLGTAQLLGALTNQLTAVEAAQGGRPVAAYLAWLGLVAAGLASGVAMRILAARMDLAMGSRLRAVLYRKILDQPPPFFHEHDSGKLNLLVNQTAVEAQTSLRRLLLDPPLQLITAGAAAGLVMYNLYAVSGGEGASLAVGAWILVFALATPFLVNWAGQRLQGASQRLQESQFGLATLVQGSLQAAEEIQALRAEPCFAAKHEDGLARWRAARAEQTWMVEAVNLLNALPGVIVQAMLLGVAVYWAVWHPERGGAGFAVAIFLLAPQLMAPVNAIATYLVMMRTSWPSVERVLEVLRRSPGAGERPGAVETGALAGPLRFQNLTFRYAPGGAPVFDGLHAEIREGEITGLVARMGEGKSTLFRLLLRFYEPEAGEIRVGRHDIRDLELACLRREIGLLVQFPAFFFDTVRENLRIADPEAGDGRLEEVARHTGLWPVLVSKFGPRPLDAPFAAGQMLSGGQRKLFALTRCLLQRPSVLLLDEPTAGMDQEEKYPLAAKLRDACQGRTVIAVDHDLAWIRHFCDRILVLEKGRISEPSPLDLPD